MREYQTWRWALALTLWWGGPLQAQVTLDGSLGRTGALSGPHYAITADLGRQVGGNLFHSFGAFSIGSGESATFSGPASVDTIVGRVTGGQLSRIDGTLRSTISGASLYLLNPSGVLFGEQARLDVPGSVHISTADYLRLSDGGRFDARHPDRSVLTVAPVEAFGFLGGAPGRIAVDGGILRVPSGQTLALIGGELTVANGSLHAPLGRLNLAAVDSAGEVVPTANGVELRGFGALGTLTVEHPAFARPHVDLGAPFGTVELGNLDVSGTGSGAGRIFIRGESWTNRSGWVFADAYGEGDAGMIDVTLAGALRFEAGARLTAATLADGAGGVVTLDVDTLTLNDGAQIATAAWRDSRGDAGSLTVNARQAVTVAGLHAATGEPSALSADALEGSTGAAGTVRVMTPVLAVEDGGVIQSAALGSGAAGSVLLDVDTLTLTGGGQIRTTTLGNEGGGALIIAARKAVIISGALSGLFADARSGSTGAGGTMWIVAPAVTVADGGIVQSTTQGADATGPVRLDVDTLTLTGGGQVVAATFGAGRGGDLTIIAREAVRIDGESSGLFATAQPGSSNRAGDITVDTARLTLTDGGQIATATFGSGAGGNITIHAREAALIAGVGGEDVFAGLYASAEGGATGRAGLITLATPHLTLREGGLISGEAQETTGGVITLHADHIRVLDGGEITSSVRGDPSSAGGDVTINSRTLVILRGGSITARANQGRGGNIIVNAEVLLHDAARIEQVLNASSQRFGNDGAVHNNAPDIDLSGSLTVVTVDYLDAAARLSQRCGGELSDERSRFLVQGRGALPLEPGGPAPTSGGGGCRPAVGLVDRAAAATTAPGFSNR